MAYASYLHVENDSRQPVQSPSLPVQANTVPKEIKTTTPLMAPEQPTVRVEADTNGTDSLGRKESDTDNTSQSRIGEESKEQRDKASVKSWNSMQVEIEETSCKPATTIETFYRNLLFSRKNHDDPRNANESQRFIWSTASGDETD